MKPCHSSTPIRRPPVASGRAGEGQRARRAAAIGHGAHSAPRRVSRGERRVAGVYCLRQEVQRRDRCRTATARGGRRGVLLVPEVGRHRPPAAGDLPSRRPGRGERPRGGSGDPRQQPPVVRRLAVHAADAAAPGHVRGQGRVLHQPRASRAGSRRSSSPAPARSRSTAAAPTRPRARSRRRAGSSRRATCSGSTPRAPARTTAGSTAARPASPGSPSRPRCR